MTGKAKISSTRIPPTLDEVAHLAGVSRATASRVVNGSPLVTDATRKAVEKSIRKLGYVPNRAARALVTRRTDTIALVVSEPEVRVFADPFFRTIVRGMSSSIQDTDLQLLLLFAQGAREQEKVERYLKQGHVDGVVLMSLHGEDPLPAALTGARIPTVLSGRPRPGERLPYVDADNRGGARTATAHLLAVRPQGGRDDHRAAGHDGRPRPPRRLQGRARRGRRSACRKNLVAYGDFSEEGGAAATAKLLKQRPDVDAIFVASDPMAFGALHALRAAGRRVPDDVAVVGFDDVVDAAVHGSAAHDRPPAARGDDARR